MLSVLSVRECLSLEEINEFVAYTGYEVTQSMLLFLEKQGYIASERLNGGLRFVLTAAGREISLEQIALAKAVEQQVVDKLGPGDAQALKIMLKRLIQTTDPGLPDLWATEPTPLVHTA
ncbi:hypothetical protein D9M73_252070 [compost metagenome]